MALKKKTFDINTLKEKYSTKTKYKEESFYNCGEAFHNACGLPGPIRGHLNLFLGHSDTSKTTAMVLTAVDAQKRGDLPVFIITEKKWKWEYAIKLGLQAEKMEDGSYDGFFIFNDSFDYVEQATDFVNTLLDEQEKGNIEQNLVFLWDSIGSIPCKMTFEGKGGKQHTASVLADKIGMGIHGRITKTLKEDVPYTNTMVFVNQPWVELPDNPYGKPVIKAKGGNAIWLASSLVFLFGNQKNAGISFITATKNGRTVSFATRTKISIMKNQVNGISYKDGKILATAHGYISDTKEAIADYKKNHSDFWNDILGEGGEMIFEEEENMIDLDE